MAYLYNFHKNAWNISEALETIFTKSTDEKPNSIDLLWIAAGDKNMLIYSTIIICVSSHSPSMTNACYLTKSLKRAVSAKSILLLQAQYHQIQQFSNKNLSKFLFQPLKSIFTF